MNDMAMNVVELRKDLELPELPAFPVRLSQFVAFDRATLTLFVTQEKRSDHLLMTWLAQAHERLPGRRIVITVVQIDEIVQMQSSGLKAGKSGADEKNNESRNRKAALDLIQKAAEFGASDLHLLMRGTHAEAQIRVKGGLLVLERMTQERAETLARAIYQGIATVRDSSYNPLEYQNAQISGEEMTRMGLTSIRIVRGPAFPVDDGGGFMIMRQQYLSGGSGRKSRERLERPRRPAGELQLARMGYSKWQIDALQYLARCPNGMILFTGPTGSGKTTGLNEVMKHIARERPDSRLVTIEDPVEYPMSWAVQMVVANASDAASTAKAFTERLRTSLRMDPDIILMGEIRDAESAIVAIDAALTGHQVWGTLHVTDPYKTVGRLELMDNVRLARGVVCDHTTLRGIVAQRLIPTLCPHCSLSLTGNETELPDTLLTALRSHGDLQKVRIRGDGCDECSGDGIAGRIAVAEVVVTDARLMDDFLAHGIDVARRNHRIRKDTDNSMIDNALVHVFAGKVDPRDAENSVDIILPKEDA